MPVKYSDIRKKLTGADIRELIDYNPETGLLYWQERDIKWFANGARPVASWKAWNSKYAGKQAFTHVSELGYKRGNLMKTPVKAHIVAWCHHYGEWPGLSVDHMNGNPADNRIANLRLAQHHQNLSNRKPIKGKQTKGVHFRKDTGKYTAYISKRFMLGCFDSEIEAQEAYNRAADLLHGDFKRVVDIGGLRLDVDAGDGVPKHL